MEHGWSNASEKEDQVAMPIKAEMTIRKTSSPRDSAMSSSLKCSLLIAITVAGLLACGHRKGDAAPPLKGSVPIEWADTVPGDFSFVHNWSYPEGVYKNEFGQLSCDGICPPEIDPLMDRTGRIFKDSLSAFYKIIDTTHRSHSLQCEAWCYEWAGTDFISVRQKGRDTIEGATECTSGTHCSLHFYIVKNHCFPTIIVNSIAHNGTVFFPCIGGSMKIDKHLLKKGILKADFDLNFDHRENPKQKMYWKGRIFTPLQSTQSAKVGHFR
jgi:hypothetical protein